MPLDQQHFPEPLSSITYITYSKANFAWRLIFGDSQVVIRLVLCLRIKLLYPVSCYSFQWCCPQVQGTASSFGAFTVGRHKFNQNGFRMCIKYSFVSKILDFVEKYRKNRRECHILPMYYFHYSCSNLLCWKTSGFVTRVNLCKLWTQALRFGMDREFYVRKFNFSTRVKMRLFRVYSSKRASSNEPESN